MRAHSRTAIAAHSGLLRLLREDEVAQISGAPFLERRGNRADWYETIRIGTTVRKRYIGEDTPETAALVARARDLAATRSDRAAHRSRLIRILRAEGFLSPDRTTGAFLNAMARTGVFRLGGTLVGTHAFRQYEGELGIASPFDQAAQTDDLNIALCERLSLALNHHVEAPLADTFHDLSFAPVPTLDGSAVWRWKQTSSDSLIEFLTPSFRPEEDIRDLPALGVSARSLQDLNYLIAEPIKAAALYRSGVVIQIPRPERFAIHKLIVSDRRRDGPDQIKSRKDRAQAAFLIRILSKDRPEDLRAAWEDARARGPNWQTRLDASLARLPETAALRAAL
jgi:hypothetical protein